MAMKGKGTFVPRGIDRAVFGFLAALNVLTGLYCASPWYLDTTTAGEKSTVLALVSNHFGVIIYGVLLCVTGIALIYAAAGKGDRLRRSSISPNTKGGRSVIAPAAFLFLPGRLLDRILALDHALVAALAVVTAGWLGLRLAVRAL